ncbi:Subtilase family protein [Clostridium cavendishii DSM 21758]|uniref:Subtilase family protein n=1 Tax=Clostridium cavendishii DSM 21758 TaxID=1121302 RepID=A0A1M6NHM5_9CLOT|nr:Subtilase family protein [Clostridium cavendishii DSM 21758]
MIRIEKGYGIGGVYKAENKVKDGYAFSEENEYNYATIEYQGDILNATNRIPTAHVYILDSSRAIIEVKGDINEVISKLSGVTVKIIPNLTDKEFIAIPHGTFATVEYQGDIVSAVKKVANARVVVIDSKRAILDIIGNIKEIQEVFNKLYDVITFEVPSLLYTLCDISVVEASGASIFNKSVYLPLDGSGVTVGIIDTGIDYLNEEFINEDGTSRILTIWDQTIESGKKPEDQYGGSEYTRDDITKAIKAKREGLNPYDIVPVRDEIGHGTSMASIVGARGVKPELIGVAPKCNFAIVKIYYAPLTRREEYGVYGKEVAYSTSVIFLALNYLNNLANRIKTPMVILLPLGTNLGSHNGLSFTERYIDDISKKKGIAVIVPTGNQGDSDTHSSGSLTDVNNYSNIELKIGDGQKNIKFEIWINRPDKFSLSIVSPSGEIIDRVPPVINKVTEIKFLYENTIIYVEYAIPEVSTGEECITIRAINIKEGIWTFKLIGELIVTGKYDAYLLQRELLAPETKFLNPDPYRTLTQPATSLSGISVGFYNQNNKSNVEESGRGYTRDGRIKPDVVAGGVKALVSTIDGKTEMITGSSVAAAVVAGCSALMFQWGIVNGNDRSLYSTKLKTYLIGGTLKQEGELYPNPEVGYGVINIKSIFDNIRFEFNDNTMFTEKIINQKEFYIGKIFIRLPL